MDYLQYIGAAITFGSALGATLASLFAVRQKSLVTLLREANKDYKDRVGQLEEDRDALQIVVQRQAGEIKQLKDERILPLTNLTKLVKSSIEQNKAMQESILQLVKSIELTQKQEK